MNTSLKPSQPSAGSRARGGVAIGLALCACAAQANLITNGDFEGGTFSGWSLFTTDHGTLGPIGNPNLPQVLSFDTAGSGASRAAAFSVGERTPIGSQDGGGIYQSFSAPAGQLSISLDIAANLSVPEQNSEGGVFSLLLDDVVLDTFRVGQIFGDTVRHTLSASGNFGAGMHELRILITRPAIPAEILTQYIDNVVVAGAQVPEPGSLGLLAIAMAGLVLTRRGLPPDGAALRPSAPTDTELGAVDRGMLRVMPLRRSCTRSIGSGWADAVTTASSAAL